MKAIYIPVSVDKELPPNSDTVFVLMNRETYNSNNGARHWGDKEFVTFPQVPMSAYYAGGEWCWEYGETMHLSEGEKLTHWLKPITELSDLPEEWKEAIKEIAGEAFDAGDRWRDHQDYYINSVKSPYQPNKQEHLNSITELKTEL